MVGFSWHNIISPCSSSGFGITICLIERRVLREMQQLDPGNRPPIPFFLRAEKGVKSRVFPGSSSTTARQLPTDDRQKVSSSFHIDEGQLVNRLWGKRSTFFGERGA